MSTTDGGFTFANNTSGWIVGTAALPLSYSLMLFKVERAAATFTRNLVVTATPSASGDGFQIGPFSHTSFPAAQWQITQSVKANTSGGDQDGQMIYRFYTGSALNGSDAAVVNPAAGSTFFTSSLYTNLAVAASQVLTTSCDLPAIEFVNAGYIFIQNQLKVTGVGGNVNRDVDLFFGANSASTVLAPDATSHPQRFTMLPEEDDQPPS